MEDEQIKVVKNWPKLTLVRDIQIFIGFANFYRHFIQGFSKIAALLTSMLKTTTSFEKSTLKVLKPDNNEVIGAGDGRAN